MARDRLTVVFSLALLGATPGAEARTVRLGCRDGIPPPRALCVAGCERQYRCDFDASCNGECEFAIRVCGELACVDHDFKVEVGERERVDLTLALGQRPTHFVLRCAAHPRRVPCPTTTTSSTSNTSSTTTTSTSGTLRSCPTTTTLGVPNCGGVGSFCSFQPRLSRPTCTDLAHGQGCGCTGPVLCGGLYAVCGGDCPSGQTCTPFAVPDGCPSIGCTCQ